MKRTIARFFGDLQQPDLLQDSTWVVKRPTLFSTHPFCSIMLQNKLHVFVASFIVLWAFYSAEVSLCCREAGKTEKDGARGTMEKKPLPSSHRPPRALSIFRLLLFLLRYTVPIGSLCGGERTLGEQCIYLNYMSEQRGILSAHVLYEEAFISSRWHVPARGERASASRSFWAKPFTLIRYLLLQVPPCRHTEWFFWIPDFLTKKSGQTKTYSSKYHLQMIIKFHFNLRFTFQTRQIVGLNNRRNTRSVAMFTL